MHAYSEMKNLLAIWQAESEFDATSLVIPDGCRDLILKSIAGEKPQWFVSSLHDQATAVSMRAGTGMIGFRLKAGVRVDEKKLITSVTNSYVDVSDVLCRLNSFTVRKPSVGLNPKAFPKNLSVSATFST